MSQKSPIRTPYTAPPSDLYGIGMTHLETALKAVPLMELVFYLYGIVRRSYSEQGATEVIIAPEDIAKALSLREHRWETGILNANTLYIGEVNGVRTVVEYRPPQITGVWFDGSAAPLRVPLPGIVMMRHSAKKESVYKLFAVKVRPTARTLKLYRAPLPNVFSSGGICWGSVAKPTQHEGNDLAADWTMLLGSGFGNHGSMSSSKKYKDDIRKFLLELDANHSKRYPISDLIEHQFSLKQEIEHANKD